MDYYELNLQKKKEIEDGLLELLQHVPFPQITVTDLARHLGMSRKSFYHYFPNRDSCLESLIDRTIQEAALYVMVNTRPGHYSAYSPEAYLANLEYWKGKAPFLTAICRNSLEAVFLSRYMGYALKEEIKLPLRMQTEEVAFDEDILLFYASGQVALLMRWCQRDFQPSAEEMARKYVRLMYSPLIRREDL